MFRSFFHKDKIIWMLFICLLPSFRSHAEPQKINYQISPSVVNGTQCVRVTASSTLDSTGKVDVPMIDRVYNFSYRMSKETKVNFEEKTRRLTAIDKPYARAEFSYDHCVQDSKSDLRLSIINKEYFYLEFLTALIFPVNIKQNLHKKFLIEVEFKSFPENFKFYGSYPIVNKKIEVVDSFQSFIKSAMWASRYDPVSVNINNQYVHVVYIGDNKKNKKRAKQLVKKIVTEQRNFWQDQDDDLYTIVFLDNALHKGKREMVGKHGSQLCSYVIDFKKEKMKKSIHQVSHELFHKWMGDTIFFSSYHSDLMWMLEGFTDYYGQKLAQQAGLLSEKEVREVVNDYLVGYHQFLVKEASQSEFLDPGHGDIMYYLLSTLRGHFIAAKLDRLKDINGNPLMPIILRELLVTFKNQSEVKRFISKEMIFDVFGKYLSEEQVNEIKDITENGKIIKFTPDFTRGKIPVMKKISVADFAFNLHDLIAKKVITGLKKDSSAFKAGLRENMKIVSHDIGLTDLKHNVTMHYLDEKGAVQVIRFKPERKKIDIPQI